MDCIAAQKLTLGLNSRFLFIINGTLFKLTGMGSWPANFLKTEREQAKALGVVIKTRTVEKADNLHDAHSGEMICFAKSGASIVRCSRDPVPYYLGQSIKLVKALYQIDCPTSVMHKGGTLLLTIGNNNPVQFVYCSFISCTPALLEKDDVLTGESEYTQCPVVMDYNLMKRSVRINGIQTSGVLKVVLVQGIYQVPVWFSVEVRDDGVLPDFFLPRKQGKKRKRNYGDDREAPRGKKLKPSGQEPTILAPAIMAHDDARDNQSEDQSNANDLVDTWFS